MNPQQSDRPERDGTLIPFPAAQQTSPGAQVEPAPDVVDAELITDAEYGRVPRLRQLPARAVRVVRESDRTAQARTVATYRLRKAPRDVARLSWFAVRGHARWIGKAWTFLTYGDLRSDARTARITGDRETRRAAQEMIRSDARARWVKLSIALTRVALGSVLLGLVAGVLAIVNATMDRADMWGWLAGLFAVLDFLGSALPWLFAALPIGWLVAAVWEGRDRTPGAGFLVRPDRDDADSWIDERMISQALAHLGIAPLDRFLKNGGELVYTVPARLDGDGTFAQIRLPMGVTADMVAARRNTLAGNLGRASLETWPTQGEEAGVLDLWVADKGKLGQGAGEWPLQHDGTVDVFEGVPVGRSQRGEIVYAPLFEANYLIGGRPGQGKSAAMRTLLLGSALDPTAELWAFVMGESPDFEPFRPRLSRYAMGLDDSVAQAATQALADLLTEMERRGRVLGEQPGSPPKTSRKLADKPRLGLHPLIMGLDECHELFMHPTYGKRAAELAVRLIKRGRKYGIILLLATQSPTKDSIPREITRNVSCGVAFAVADHVANDGLLGAGKYKAGIRANDLRMKTDRGTSVAVGLTDNVFELLRWFYVPFEDGIDMVTPVIARAMSGIGELRRTGQTPDNEQAPEVDHLADIADVLNGERRVRTQVVLSRLAERNPDEYEGWTFAGLRAALAVHGVEPVKSGGVMVVRTADVTQALTERADGGDDDDHN